MYLCWKNNSIKIEEVKNKVSSLEKWESFELAVTLILAETIKYKPVYYIFKIKTSVLIYC